MSTCLTRGRSWAGRPSTRRLVLAPPLVLPSTRSLLATCCLVQRLLGSNCDGPALPRHVALHTKSVGCCHDARLRPTGATRRRRRDHAHPTHHLAGRLSATAAPTHPRPTGRGLDYPQVAGSNRGPADAPTPGAGRGGDRPPTDRPQHTSWVLPRQVRRMTPHSLRTKITPSWRRPRRSPMSWSNPVGDVAAMAADCWRLVLIYGVLTDLRQRLPGRSLTTVLRVDFWRVPAGPRMGSAGHSTLMICSSPRSGGMRHSRPKRPCRYRDVTLLRPNWGLRIPISGNVRLDAKPLHKVTADRAKGR